MILQLYNKIREAELEAESKSNLGLKLKDEPERTMQRRNSIRKIEREINELNKTSKPT